MKQVIIAIALMVGIQSFAATMSEASFKKAVDKAVDFITAREGFRSQWYCDGCGKTLASRSAKCTRKECANATPTIGHGLTLIYWEKQTINPEQSKAIVRSIVEKDARELLKGLNRAPSINNLAALCSLAYRRGVRPILRSKTFKAVNDGNWTMVSREWREFNTYGGKVMRGLNIRCDEELKLFYAK